MSENYVGIACDVGGTHLRIAVADRKGNVERMQKRTVRNVQGGYSPEQVFEFLTEQISLFQKKIGQALRADAPLVCSVPGPVKDHRHLLGAPPLLEGATNVPDLHGMLVETLRRPVQIINDMSAAAWYLSRKIPGKRLLVVTISTGIGSKIFDPQHPLGVLDEQPFAGEIGHMVVDSRRRAPKCDCGGRGHLGAIASGRGYQRAARRLARSKKEEFAASACVRKFGASAETISNEEHIVPAAIAGDEWAIRLLRRGVRSLAQPLMAIVLAADIDRIVLIGGLAQSLGTLYENMLREELREVASQQPGFAPDLARLITIRKKDEQTCLQGAGVYLVRFLQDAEGRDTPTSEKGQLRR